MKQQFLLAAILLLVSPAFTSGADPAPAPAEVRHIGNPAPPDAPVREIEMSARKYEFSPSRVEVTAGTLLRIHLTALDREHGFQIDSIEDSCVKYKPGRPVTVEFYAGTPGEYGFSCCKYCGFGHGKMKGTLIVK